MKAVFVTSLMAATVAWLPINHAPLAMAATANPAAVTAQTPSAAPASTSKTSAPLTKTAAPAPGANAASATKTAPPASSAAVTAAAKSAAAAKQPTLSQVIDVYEQKFFERTFDGENEGRRLDRLDNFIFGTVNPGTPQSRVGMIAKVVEVNTPPPGAAPSRQSNQSPGGQTRRAEPAEGPALESPGNYPHITALEAKLLNNTYPNDGLNARLGRLETKAFGAPSKSRDFEERTDALDRYMQEKTRPKDTMIGHMPLNDEDIAPASPEMERRYESASEDPGSLMRQEEFRRELADAQKATPPTKDERTLSRIAWCEQQVFGHAFPELHLLQRLHQLNHELNPKDKEPDIQLMDRIDTIVKEVVLRKHPHQPGET